MKLDEAQRAAALDISPRVAIVAGAGAGKTRVLVERIRHLLDDRRVDPRRIVACTFTTAAATELADRIGPETMANGLFAGTMHAWAYERLRERAAEVGLTPSFSIYDQDDADAIRAQCVASVGRRDAPALFAARCREANAVTYDSLLELVASLPNPWRGVEHVLVDEAQDLNAQQWDMLGRAMFGGPLYETTVTCVGDYRQAIFGWRGATPQRFREYIANVGTWDGSVRWVQGHAHELRANYRSGPAIVEAANAVWGEDAPLMHVARDDGDAGYHPPETIDACEIAERCRALHENTGTPWERIAVLGRTWRDLYEVADHLDLDGDVPSVIGRPVHHPWSSDGAIELSRWIRLHRNPSDDNLTALLLHRNTVARLRDEAKRGRVSLFVHAVAGGYLPRTEAVTTEQLVVDYAESMHPGHRLADGMLEALRRPSRRTPKAFAWWWAFGRDTTTAPNAVQLLTVHGAKGLEFDAVFVLRPEGMRSEREVLYTALTRARDRLFLVDR